MEPAPNRRTVLLYAGLGLALTCSAAFAADDAVTAKDKRTGSLKTPRRTQQQKRQDRLRPDAVKRRRKPGESQQEQRQRRARNE